MIPNANTALGRALRWPLRLMPHNAVVPVLTGLNRGLKWRVGSSNHGCWIGTYETEKQRIFAALVKPGTTFFDVGANVGFYSLAAARHGAHVWAFEPLPENIIDLERHVAINRLPIAVVRAAVCDRAGFAHIAGRAATAHMSDAGVLVSTVALDELSLPAPDVVKIDVEGAELAVLQGARRLIAQRRATWLVALDEHDTAAACCALLREAGYSVETFGGGIEIIARP